MKVAIIGSRELMIDNLEKYLPGSVTEIVTCGESGIDTCAAEYAKKAGLKFTEFLSEYDKFGKQAPLMRNIAIIQYADLVLAFWDGQSEDTQFVIETCNALNKTVKIFILKAQ
jgi:hypothetical protein